MGTAAQLQHLLVSGQLRRSSALPSHGLPGDRAPATWGLPELAGRVVELTGAGGATALLTVAVELVLEAQQAGEPVAWVTHPAATVFPPDVAGNGVDLDALVFVRVCAADAMLRAADHLLRSGAFGLTVLDLPARIDVPLPVQVRLSGLAKKHGATLVFLFPVFPGGAAPGNSLASLRAASERRRVGVGRFESVLHVSKDKRRGRGWSHVQRCDGAVGLR